MRFGHSESNKVKSTHRSYCLSFASPSAILTPPPVSSSAILTPPPFPCECFFFFFFFSNKKTSFVPSKEDKTLPKEDELTLLHSEWPNLYGHSECKRVKGKNMF